MQVSKWRNRTLIKGNQNTIAPVARPSIYTFLSINGSRWDYGFQDNLSFRLRFFKTENTSSIEKMTFKLQGGSYYKDVTINISNIIWENNEFIDSHVDLIRKPQSKFPGDFKFDLDFSLQVFHGDNFSEKLEGSVTLSSSIFGKEIESLWPTNILVFGGVGHGKSSFLNVIATSVAKGNASLSPFIAGKSNNMVTTSYDKQSISQAAGDLDLWVPINLYDVWGEKMMQIHEPNGGIREYNVFNFFSIDHFLKSRIPIGQRFEDLDRFNHRKDNDLVDTISAVIFVFNLELNNENNMNLMARHISMAIKSKYHPIIVILQNQVNINLPNTSLEEEILRRFPGEQLSIFYLGTYDHSGMLRNSIIDYGALQILKKAINLSRDFWDTIEINPRNNTTWCLRYALVDYMNEFIDLRESEFREYFLNDTLKNYFPFFAFFNKKRRDYIYNMLTN